MEPFVYIHNDLYTFIIAEAVCMCALTGHFSVVISLCARCADDALRCAQWHTDPKPGRSYGFFVYTRVASYGFFPFRVRGGSLCAFTQPNFQLGRRRSSGANEKSASQPRLFVFWERFRHSNIEKMAHLARRTSNREKKPRDAREAAVSPIRAVANSANKAVVGARAQRPHTFDHF